MPATVRSAPERPQAPARNPASPLRNAAEGAGALLAAVAVMAATGQLALAALGAAELGPSAALTAALTSMAVGGRLTLSSATTGAPAPEGGASLLDLLAGSTGGPVLTVEGTVSFLPLTLTLLGTVVLGLGFFRPLRRRARPTRAVFLARALGALGAAALLFPAVAHLARGELRLPPSALGTFGGGAAPQAGGALLDRFKEGLSTVRFEADAGSVVFLGLVWVVAVLGLGCVVARRTHMPQAVEASRPRRKWNPVASAVTGLGAAVCLLGAALATLTTTATLTGRGEAAKAAGGLLLTAPNLLVALFGSGLGSSWQAERHRQRAQGGGLFQGLGGGLDTTAAGQSTTGAAERTVDLGGLTVAGLPVWLIGLALLLSFLLAAGYLAAARTPSRTARQETEALLSRHLELGLRLGALVCLAALVLPALAHGSAGLGFSVLGMDLGGVTAALDGGSGLAPLTGLLLGLFAGYTGSRLRALRVATREGTRLPAPSTPG
ncbi:streptophobe family protein [Streptomyces sp. NPDC006879]|uniref:streptophobe family protein n=1 Tax=Streptomyces sp. NPDC006879 TaxID=3364767 RepID=UPI0036BBCD83